MNETDQQAEMGGAAGNSPPSLAGYRSGRRLGTGGSASVWLVTSEHDGRQLAAKVFAPGSDTVTASQLRREVELLGGLDHEHLVRLHEVLEAEDGTTLLMDYAAGDSLAALVGARGPLPVEEVVTILTPMARCLAYLHGNGVTHSDVAPGNVLFTEHGKPLLADLGLGRMRGEGGSSTAGTAGFVSAKAAGPDQHGRLRAEDDIHGLAAVGWYALTGRVPAAGDRRPPLPVVIPGVPEELALIIEAGLDPSPERRPSAGEFAQAVFHSAQPAPINLVPVVHESVLPHLLTRRNVMEHERKSGKRSRKLSSWKFPVRTDKQPRRVSGKRPAAGGIGLRILAAGGIFLVAAIAAGAVLGDGGAEPAVLSETAAQSEATVRPGAAPLSGTEGQGKGTSGSSSSPSPAGSNPSKLPDGMQHQLKASDPRKAVPALAQLRSYAFSSGRTELLDRVNVAGSPAMSADRRIAERIERTDHVFAGFETRISAVERLEALEGQQRPTTAPSGDPGQTTAFVAVTASSDGFVEKDKQGNIVRRNKRDHQQQLILELQRVDGQWLIANVMAPRASG
ncbi:MAG TPA: serine/threonine-protein kinase [Arthrobacter sp.]|nr:serine/threonine-protein kinase [Arthrobacter sp.]